MKLFGLFKLYMQRYYDMHENTGASDGAHVNTRPVAPPNERMRNFDVKVDERPEQMNEHNDKKLCTL